MFEQAPFHFPEFFSVQGPAVALEGFTDFNKGIFEGMPEPLHDIEVVVLQGGIWPDFSNHFGKGRPEVEDNTVGLNTSVAQLAEESFGHAPAIQLRNWFDIEDPDLATTLETPQSVVPIRI
jgi:hypothetical protein